MRQTILRTPRLVVTTWQPSDLEDLARLHGDPAAMQHMTTGVQSREATQERLREWIAEHEARGWSKWRVHDQAGALVGRAGFGTAHETGHREVGYLLSSPHWGRGLATELLQGLVRWHVEHPAPGLGLDLLAYVFQDNHGSRRVLAKYGFVEVAATTPRAGELAYRLPLSG